MTPEELAEEAADRVEWRRTQIEVNAFLVALGIMLLAFVIGKMNQ